jgi:uncharacterized protein YebE (UPF0316 family)
MTWLDFLDTNVFNWGILPILIFFARICDQSIGTLRVIFISKGYKNIAPFLGFFESLIWLIAISQIMGQLDNWVSYVFYAAGYATGSYIGLIIDEKLLIGTVVIRIIPKYDTTELLKYLKVHDYGVTTFDVEGMSGKLKMILTIVKRKEAKDVIKLVNVFNPNAFYTIEEVKSVREGYFGSPWPRKSIDIINPNIRKSK